MNQSFVTVSHPRSGVSGGARSSRFITVPCSRVPRVKHLVKRRIATPSVLRRLQATVQFDRHDQRERDEDQHRHIEYRDDPSNPVHARFPASRDEKRLLEDDPERARDVYHYQCFRRRGNHLPRAHRLVSLIAVTALAKERTFSPAVDADGTGSYRFGDHSPPRKRLPVLVNVHDDTGFTMLRGCIPRLHPSGLGYAQRVRRVR